MILDGWGLSTQEKGNAIYHARTPNMDHYMKTYPFTSLRACCESVGLPPHQMGNSEVGHLNMGAGRVVYSPLMRLNTAIQKGEFQNNKVLLSAMRRAKKKGRPIHLVGMVSDGGVHSHIKHLQVLVEMAERTGVRAVVHAITDGRDTPPRVAEIYLQSLEDVFRECGCGRIADVSGRYYAMDRDRRWERTKLAYLAMVKGKGVRCRTTLHAIRAAYERGEGDEFVRPTVICPDGNEPVMSDLINNGDEVIFFNFRPDRARQLSHALADEDFNEFKRERFSVNLTTMMQYETELNAMVAFPPEALHNVLGEVLSKHGIRQLRIAETEKYAHVTFFFNGGKETPFPGEKRILIPSPQVSTYDLQPEMSAAGIVEHLLSVLKDYDMVVLNFANPDMVGHTGIFEAAVKAVETVDDCMGKVVKAVLEMDGTVFITADHGNAEMMMDEDGNPHTAHTLNPVPFIWVSREAERYAKEGKGVMSDGAITNIAPTILRVMGIPVPQEMTSNSLISEEIIKHIRE